MFLTLEDPRAKVQGSRDPLGALPIWAAFGRKLVTNLTTVSNSVRGFTILLLARYYTERLIEDREVGEEDALSVFLRMEQIGAYARHKGHGAEGDIRGIERVKRFLVERKGRPIIQDDPDGMILSDQRTYGLWGLFSVPARVSRLIEDGPIGLTSEARAFVETQYRPRLRSIEPELLRLLRSGGVLNTDRRNPLFAALTSVVPNRFSKPEQLFYRKFLRDGEAVLDAAPQRQGRLAKLLIQHASLTEWIGRKTILNLATNARSEDDGLADRLEKVARLEALLAPAESLFAHVQVRPGQTVAKLADHLREHWGRKVPNLDRKRFAEIKPEIVDAVGSDLTGFVDRTDRALGAGDYGEAIKALLEWNAVVMRQRKAAPWVRVQRGKIDVRYRGQEAQLPDASQLPTLWRNTYFLDSLRDVTRQLGRTA